MRRLFILTVISVGLVFATEIIFFDDSVVLKSNPTKIDLQREGVIQFYRDGEEVLEIYSDEIGTIVIDEDCNFIRRKDKNTIINSCAVENSIGSGNYEPDTFIIEDPSNCWSLYPNLGSCTNLLLDESLDN